ncbi:MAG: formate/nitrite transporter family protein [Methanobrevibacter sp.]|jgi:formate/nitrite transporter|nr:formate/nitrite transporter family protein [Methanobrevibacter sp.]
MGSSFKNPTETAKAIVGLANLKNNSPLVNVLILGFLGGAYIGFGGLLAEIVTAGMGGFGFPPGLIKLFFAGVFPVGLMLVVIAGSELFTGNIMYMPMGVLSKKASLKGLSRNWALSWIFNFVGALFIAYVLAYLTGIMTPEPFATEAMTIATKKAALSWDQALLRGIGCNWLVCLGVYLAIASDDIIGKIAGMWFPVMTFVAIGFEHSVANMFFIPLGMLLGADITISQLFLNNLIPVTIGNIIGGALFVAIFYWYVYLRGQNI